MLDGVNADLNHDGRSEFVMILLTTGAYILPSSVVEEETRMKLTEHSEEGWKVAMITLCRNPTTEH